MPTISMISCTYCHLYFHDVSFIRWRNGFFFFGLVPVFVLLLLLLLRVRPRVKDLWLYICSFALHFFLFFSTFLHFSCLA
jgi:hypothetical protein